MAEGSDAECESLPSLHAAIRSAHPINMRTIAGPPGAEIYSKRTTSRMP